MTFKTVGMVQYDASVSGASCAGTPRIKEAPCTRARAWCFGLFVLALTTLLALPAPSFADSAEAYMSYPSTATEEPDVQSPYAAVFDDSGTVLWSRNADTQTPMASTTKIMTALLVLENKNLDDVVTVSEYAASQEPTVIGLYAGEQITIRDLLYGLMLVSGNDAAVALAESVGGSVDGFVEMMNAKAAELGMVNTHFVTPNGLHDDAHYTTVKDYVKLTVYAMENADFRTIVKTISYTSTDLAGVTAEYTTSNDLLAHPDTYTSTPGALTNVLGIKTGFTDEAGYCLVSGDTERELTAYAIVFGASDAWTRFSDSAHLLEWYFAHQKNVELISAKTVIGSYACRSWPDKTVDISVCNTVNASIYEYGGDITCKVVVDEKMGDIKKSDPVGTITFYKSGEVIGSSELYVSEDVAAPNMFESFQLFIQNQLSNCTGQSEEKTQTVIDINAELTLV